MKRNWIRWLTMLLIAALLLAGCGTAPAPQTPETVTLTLVETTVPTAPEKNTPRETEGPVQTAPPETAPPVQTLPAETEPVTEPEEQISENGTYTSKDEVAAYLHLFGHLPSNYITKKEAQELGWVSNQGNLHKVAPGMSIGGDRFGNYEGLLPKAKGRSYTECDIDFDGRYRNAKRIIFSNDGLIYYTEDHYASFELLYGEE